MPTMAGDLPNPIPQWHQLHGNIRYLSSHGPILKDMKTSLKSPVFMDFHGHFFQLATFFFWGNSWHGIEQSQAPGPLNLTPWVVRKPLEVRLERFFNRG